MKASTFLLLASALSLNVAFAQVPAEDLDPNHVYRPPIELGDAGECDNTEALFDIQAIVSDNGILGVAHNSLTGKWFFSGRAAGPPFAVYILDSDANGRPIPTGYRTIPSAVTTGVWGHRDGSDDPGTPFVYFGDESSTLHEIDAVSEAYTGRSWTFAGSASGTIRALACKTNPTTGLMEVWHSDFANAIEKWTIDLATGAVANTGVTLPNQGSHYGLALTDSMGNPGACDMMAIHHQVTNSCPPPNANNRITVLDMTGRQVWIRGNDQNIASATGQGGVAGGLETAIVSGQPVFAAVGQATSDSCGFLPKGNGGYSKFGPPDCNGELRCDPSPVVAGSLLPNTGQAMIGRTLVLNTHSMSPTSLGALLWLDVYPTAGIPIGPGCTLDARVGISAIFIGSTGPNGTFTLGIPPGPFDGVNFFGEVGTFDPGNPMFPLGSTNIIDIHLHDPRY